MQRRPALGALALTLALLPGCKDDPSGPGGDDAGDTTDGSDDAASEGTADETGTPPGELEPEPVYLSPVEHLTRVSMALRGIRPSEQELQAVADDPEALPGIVDDYLQDPRFGAIIRDLHNDVLLLRADFPLFPVGFIPRGPVADADFYELNRSITEASLRLVEYVVLSDLPYTEIVTADYAVADGNVAGVWGLPYDGTGESWELTEWPDDRAGAGVLSDPWFYQRFQSTVSNANRGRANAISRGLLCYDFLSRDIEVDSSVDLADPDAVANAVVDNPACASCHQGLDPLAGFLKDWFPVYVPSDGIDPDNPSYPFDPYVEDIFVDIGATVRDPGYFGQAGEGMSALGQFVAEDPRFSLCAAQRFYAYLHQVNLDDVPLERAAALQSELVDTGMSARALVRAIVLDDEFRISHWEEQSERDLTGVKRARPVQLAALMSDLTGFRWETTIDLTGLVLQLAPDLMVPPGEQQPTYPTRIDLLDDSFFGYGVLGGGIDSLFVTQPAYTYGATASLTLRNLAREAANAVVDADLATPDLDARRLLTLVTETDTEEGVIRDQLAALHLRILARLVEPDGPEVDESYALFEAALDHSGDVARAWKVTLTAMLQDVEIAYY
ncbi:MAG: hypothetical protein KDK70_10465 [Myxococcales bacterium]|nr:hypothetical protein [Myxococcales bacterium]